MRVELYNVWKPTSKESMRVELYNVWKPTSKERQNSPPLLI